MKKSTLQVSVVRAVAVIALAFFNASCGDDASGGGASSARSGNNSHAEGKLLYLTRCTSCHVAEKITDYSAAEWRSIMPEMAEESKMTSAQERAVLEYVLSELR